MIDIVYLFRRIMHRLRGRVVHLSPQGTSRGNVLVSYTTLPYLDQRQIVLDAHTNRWECMQIASTFHKRGYTVDIIDGTDVHFVPTKTYAYFLVESGSSNGDQIIQRLNPECIKIFYGATCHWKFLNEAERLRLNDIERRRGVRLPTVRQLKPTRTWELCDVALMLGNDTTMGTYPPTKKSVTRIGLSTTHIYPSPAEKNFQRAQGHFIWFGGAGLAHKGVDLLLEAFAAMPECTLTLIGKIDPVDPFAQAYRHEMYTLPNIKTVGWLNPSSDHFKEICANTLGLVYPSSSEGCAGSVVLCMHAGLIPIVSRESGTETGDFGITLKEKSVACIQEAVRALLHEHTDKLRERAVHTWEYARVRHTREQFAQTFATFVGSLEK